VNGGEKEDCMPEFSGILQPQTSCLAQLPILIHSWTIFTIPEEATECEEASVAK
jgi:hypothetical protein